MGFWAETIVNTDKRRNVNTCFILLFAFMLAKIRNFF